MTYAVLMWTFGGNGSSLFPTPRDVFETVEEAKLVFQATVGIDAHFVDKLVENGLTHYPREAFDKRKNIAVIYRLETGDVVSVAEVGGPTSFFPA